MSGSGLSMTLRNRQKRPEISAAEESQAPARPYKRQRKSTDKDVSTVGGRTKQRVTASRPRTSRARAVRSAAPSASPPKHEHFMGSESPIKAGTSEAALESPSPFAQLRTSQSQRRNPSRGAVLGRNAVPPTPAAVLESTPTHVVIDSTGIVVHDSRVHERRTGVEHGNIAALRAELKAKDNIIEELRATLSRKEEESKSISAITQGQRAAEIMQTLEDMHSCSLCFEILACPYSLTPPKCGHTFCSICLLKWFFTHLDPERGHWRQDLECPLCCTPLPATSIRAPRPVASCPFTPGRLLEDTITALVNTLSSIVQPQNGESSRNSPGKGSPGKGKGKARQVEEASLIFLDGGEEALDWKKGGKGRTEWENRTQLGRQKMNFLVSHWTTMTPGDFVRFRASLGIRSTVA